MKTIWKFPLEPVPLQHVTMPSHAQPLCVQMQCGKPCIWALVDSETSNTTSRRVRIAATGQEFDDFPAGDYLGTVQLAEGHFVFHVFVQR